MICSLSEIKNKEVVNVSTGLKIGFVDDVQIDTSLSSVVSFVIYGRSRCMGLLGREDDIIIKCENIQLVGEDTILVKFHDDAISPKARSISIENLLK